MKILVFHGAAVLLALTLGACATSATPYRPATPDKPLADGFIEQQIEPDRMRVTFRGNSATRRESVESAMLYRAAELTLARGYDWFTVTDRSTDRSTDRTTSVYATPGEIGFGHGAGLGMRGGHGFAGHWRGANLHTGWGATVRTSDSFAATAEIQLRKGSKPADDALAFDARLVLESLGSRIRRPPV